MLIILLFLSLWCGISEWNLLYKVEYSNGGNVIRYTDGDTRKQKTWFTQKLCSLLVYFTNTVSMLVF